MAQRCFLHACLPTAAAEENDAEFNYEKAAESAVLTPGSVFKNFCSKAKLVEPHTSILQREMDTAFAKYKPRDLRGLDFTAFLEFLDHIAGKLYPEVCYSFAARQRPQPPPKVVQSNGKQRTGKGRGGQEKQG